MSKSQKIPAGVRFPKIHTSIGEWVAALYDAALAELGDVRAAEEVVSLVLSSHRETRDLVEGANRELIAA